MIRAQSRATIAVIVGLSLPVICSLHLGKDFKIDTPAALRCTVTHEQFSLYGVIW